MKRIGTVGLALAMAAGIAAATHAGKENLSSWTGWITDAKCGVKNANEQGKACVLDCAKQGAKLLLYVEEGGLLLDLDDQSKAKKHVGHPVRVSGVLDGSTIKVKKIKHRDPQPSMPVSDHGFGAGHVH